MTVRRGHEARVRDDRARIAANAGGGPAAEHEVVDPGVRRVGVQAAEVGVDGDVVRRVAAAVLPAQVHAAAAAVDDRVVDGDHADRAVPARDAVRDDVLDAVVRQRPPRRGDVDPAAVATAGGRPAGGVRTNVVNPVARHDHVVRAGVVVRAARADRRDVVAAVDARVRDLETRPDVDVRADRVDRREARAEPVLSNPAQASRCGATLRPGLRTVVAVHEHDRVARDSLRLSTGRGARGHLGARRA
jgi:hypothetical protein